MRRARMENSAREGRAHASLARRTRYQTQPKAPVFRVKNVLSGKVSFHFAVEMPTLVAALVQRVSSALAETMPASGVSQERLQIPPSPQSAILAGPAQWAKEW